MRSLRLASAMGAALLALTAPGCGGGPAPDAPRTEAQSVVVDGLVYRALLFRQLNPRIAPDRRLLEGTARDDAGSGGRLMFGAFVEVCNRSERPQSVPEDFEVVDAFGQAYRRQDGVVAEPFDLESGSTLEPGQCMPRGGGTADTAAPGALLAFGLPRKALADRPLFLVVPSDVADDGPPARIQLSL